MVEPIRRDAGFPLRGSALAVNSHAVMVVRAYEWSSSRLAPDTRAQGWILNGRILRDVNVTLMPHRLVGRKSPYFRILFTLRTKNFLYSGFASAHTCRPK